MKSYADRFHLQGGEIIRQITFGMNDGVVSIFALLAGMAGAGQPPETILITLVAASVAGAVSMAAGEFISGKSEADYYRHEIEQEELEIELCPDIEREELRRILSLKGLAGAVLDEAVTQISHNRRQWVREMVMDELGTTELEHDTPIRESLIIFVAFIGGSLFPTLPYLLLAHTGIAADSLFFTAVGITVGGLFCAGALKRFVTGVNWFKSGLEMLAVGIFAFCVSYGVGLILPV
ncbi:MAG: VIT1/CCC1 transporter family protein [Fibrobacterota bacterium]